MNGFKFGFWKSIIDMTNELGIWNNLIMLSIIEIFWEWIIEIDCVNWKDNELFDFDNCNVLKIKTCGLIIDEWRIVVYYTKICR